MLTSQAWCLELCLPCSAAQDQAGNRWVRLADGQDGLYRGSLRSSLPGVAAAAAASRRSESLPCRAAQNQAADGWVRLADGKALFTRAFLGMSVCLSLLQRRRRRRAGGHQWIACRWVSGSKSAVAEVFSFLSCIHGEVLDSDHAVSTSAVNFVLIISFYKFLDFQILLQNF